MCDLSILVYKSTLGFLQHWSLRNNQVSFHISSLSPSKASRLCQIPQSYKNLFEYSWIWGLRYLYIECHRWWSLNPNSYALFGGELWTICLVYLWQLDILACLLCFKVRINLHKLSPQVAYSHVSIIKTKPWYHLLIKPTSP